MRKSFILILLLIYSTLSTDAVELTKEGIAIRDSIFRELNKIEGKEERVEFLRAKVQNHMGQEWTIQLLDSALSSLSRGYQPLTGRLHTR